LRLTLFKLRVGIRLVVLIALEEFFDKSFEIDIHFKIIYIVFVYLGHFVREFSDFDASHLCFWHVDEFEEDVLASEIPLESEVLVIKKLLDLFLLIHFVCNLSCIT
jgi:hypothetical protein